MAKPEPQSRGIEDEAPAKVTTPSKITKVISSGPGWMQVEMNDGMKYKLDGGSIAWRCRNPGNVNYGTFAKEHGAVGQAHNGTAVFATVADGRLAMRALLFNKDSRYAPLSIKKAIAVYAPEYDGNDPVNYCDFVCQTARLSYTRTISSLSNEEQSRMLEAMMKMEGTKPGKLFKVAK